MDSKKFRWALGLSLVLLTAPVVSDAVAPQASALHRCDPLIPCCHVVDCLPPIKASAVGFVLVVAFAAFVLRRAW